MFSKSSAPQQSERNIEQPSRQLTRIEEHQVKADRTTSNFQTTALQYFTKF
jgi:hypothetical protein